MHFVFYLRGILNQVELWKTIAQGQFWKWERINIKTKKKETIIVQGALRPSVMGAWEYIFPEECLPDVLAMFGVQREEYTHADRFKDAAKLKILRKALGVKAIPKEAYEEAKKCISSILLENSWRALTPINVPGIAIHPIGIKEDDRRDMEWGFNQEAL